MANRKISLAVDRLICCRAWEHRGELSGRVEHRLSAGEVLGLDAIFLPDFFAVSGNSCRAELKVFSNILLIQASL